MTIIRSLRLCLITALFALIAGFALAQSTGSSSSNPMDDIIKSATDSGMQVIVINPDGPSESAEQTEEEQYHGSLLMKTQERAYTFRTTLRNRVARAPEALEEIIFILNGQSPTGHYSIYFFIVMTTLASLILAELIVRETYGKRLVGPWFISLQKPDPIGYTDKLPILLLRTVLAMIGLALVVMLSYGVGIAIFGESEDGTVRLTVAYIYLTYIVTRSVVFLWRMILSPYLEKYRIPHFSDKDAHKLFYWLWTVATISAIVVNFCAWMKELGLSYDIHALLTSTLTLFVVFLNVAMVLVNRRAVSEAILNGERYEEASLPTRIASQAWAPLVIAYFFIAWAEMTYRLIEAQPLGLPLITGFYLVLLTVTVVYGIVGYLIERFFHRQRLLEQWRAKAAEDSHGPDASSDITKDDEEAEEELAPFLTNHKMHTYEDLSRRIANILAVVAAFWAISEIWQIDIDMIATTQFDRIYDIVTILFIGYVIYHFVRIWIDQKIAEEGGDAVEVAPGDEGGAGGASRLATLLPLFRNFLLAIIFVAFALIALTNIGINVSALFAGAGVVGLAIGFGAQALVRDIFSGAFFLFDDAFRKGEYIDIGSVKGTVEKISVRSFQLRHHLGPLHTVPFGEIQHLTNFSRDWVMMKLKLRVTYDTDVEKVRKLVKKLGQELLEDEVVGHQFLQPLKSQGVIEMQDSAMIIRVKFMTKPGDQWILRKRVYQEIRDLFEREGIRFAHKEVTVRLADVDPDDLTKKQKEAVGAAALAAIEEDEMQGQPEGNTDDDR
ncbi:mechanosensitive ion channel family protein [Neptunicoccus cionae]|uniref:mechanosensitive ion channel family protein n=1 Tax=Neptunicoccus cionae TaxID=2035344 RepID=UPI000C78D8A2|nr:mechanosensitive ion channel family protein [Amylibacter cionae]PLS22645.1 mechanosensitive ion channel protein MscS [Amylibacter cionae]